RARKTRRHEHRDRQREQAHQEQRHETRARRMRERGDVWSARGGQRDLDGWLTYAPCHREPRFLLYELSPDVRERDRIAERHEYPLAHRLSHGEHGPGNRQLRRVGPQDAVQPKAGAQCAERRSASIANGEFDVELWPACEIYAADGGV